MINEIYSGISFADAQLESYNFDSEKELLEVRITAWDGKIITAKFHEVIGVFSYGAKKVGGFFEELDQDTFFADAIKNYFDPSVDDKILSHHQYHCYKFIDYDDSVILKVISKSVVIGKS